MCRHLAHHFTSISFITESFIIMTSMCISMDTQSQLPKISPLILSFYYAPIMYFHAFFTPFCSLCDPSSQRELRVYTDQPGVQLYSGNFLDGTYIGKDGQPIIKHGGVCLETQSWPNAINNPEAREQMLLRPGHEYKSRTVWALSW